MKDFNFGYQFLITAATALYWQEVFTVWLLSSYVFVYIIVSLHTSIRYWENNCMLCFLQAEDRAVEANKTVTSLQKDVDRIEGNL